MYYMIISTYRDDVVGRIYENLRIDEKIEPTYTGGIRKTIGVAGMNINNVIHINKCAKHPP